MVTRQAQMSREKRRSIRLKTDSMQTRMKMDRKRKRAAGTVIRNVRWSSVFWGEGAEGDVKTGSRFQVSARATSMLACTVKHSGQLGQVLLQSSRSP